jgi:pantetheine-phosphate adenylyltransferase
MNPAQKNTVIYPGSFDPITNGHLDLIERALRIFDTIIVAVANNPDKKPLFSVDERMHMIRESVDNDSRVIVDTFEGLLVEYTRRMGVTTILRGMRAMSDFEYEYEMTFMNRKLDRDVETIFMITGLRWFFVHSKVIKSAVKAGACVEGLVPDIVCTMLEKKINGA